MTRGQSFATYKRAQGLKVNIFGFCGLTEVRPCYVFSWSTTSSLDMAKQVIFTHQERLFFGRHVAYRNVPMGQQNFKAPLLLFLVSLLIRPKLFDHLLFIRITRCSDG